MNAMRQSPRQSRSRRPFARGAILCLLLAAVAVGGVRAEVAGEPTNTELRALFDQLAESAVAGDDAGVDAATCLDDLVRAQLAREEALGLVPDAGDPAMVAKRKEDARAGVRAFIGRLLESGGDVERTDVSRIQLFTDPDEPVEALSGEGQGALEITGSGILGIEMLGSQRMIDIDVLRLGERWCLNPLSMQ
jgi:hypothetical protein